ncbi:hypothetical protein [Novosphingobium colocasiae]|uniref:Uncharacterized protein n=1 Tax=Novosphingobium colocasiae TaxID=1256513 RepID=A0A918PHL9_9SPHN|nr:hypothetical protein [Novosphingobium colocasiae]GGZ10185.1 hypothetical protein GCM10011614_26360 [Novosphingobium colocasiae]
MNWFLQRVAIMAGGVALAGMPAPAFAADDPAPANDPAVDPFAQAMAARSVADYARRTKDPYAMITAARMLAEIPVSDGDTAAGAEASFSPKALYAEARVLADGDATLLEQITVAESVARRGVMTSAFGSGLVRRVLSVDPRGAYQFSLDAKGGETLRLGAIGSPGTSLLIRMVDKSGKVVCLDDHGDYAPVCQLKPKANARYRVDILNKSPAKSQTVVLSN